jgi:hypothetical protein
MPKPPTEPTNLILEQLRAMRAENATRFDAMDNRFAALETEVRTVRTAVRGIGSQVIAEVYKGNKTVASFADLEMRLEAVERKLFP